MDSEAAIGLALLVPIMGALFIWITRSFPNVREAVTLLTSCLLFLIVLSITPSVSAGLRPSLEFFELFPGLAITFSFYHVQRDRAADRSEGPEV